MDDESIKRDLLGLTAEEAFCIYETRCLNKSMAKVDEETDSRRTKPTTFHNYISSGTVSTTARSGLRFLRIENVDSDHCRILTELVGMLGNPPDWRQWPPIVYSPTPPISEIQEEPPTLLERILNFIRNLNISPMTIGMGALLLACLFGAWGIGSIIRGNNPIPNGEGQEIARDEVTTTPQIRIVPTEEETPVPSTIPTTPAPTRLSMEERYNTTVANTNETATSYYLTRVTPSPTSTQTGTPTNTPTATSTVLQVTTGVLSDERVSLELLEWQINLPWNYITLRIPFAAGFKFSFANNSGEEIQLGIDRDDFTLTTDNGTLFNCTFPVSNEVISGPVANGTAYEFWVLCGREVAMPVEARTLYLRIVDFSSLPDAEWIVEIPR